MLSKAEYNKKVGERVKKIREAKGITQWQLLETIGSRSLEDGSKKANLIYMIERGDRSLTGANIQKIAEKYNILPGYLRLETDYMTEEEELRAGNEKYNSEQGIRKQYFQMLLTLHGYIVRYKDGKCVITDKNGHSTSFDRDSLLETISDFEKHFTFQVQLRIDRETHEKQILEVDKRLLGIGEE